MHSSFRPILYWELCLMKYEINWIISTKQAHLTLKLAYKKHLQLRLNSTSKVMARKCWLEINHLMAMVSLKIFLSISIRILFNYVKLMLAFTFLVNFFSSLLFLAYLLYLPQM